MKDQNYDPTTNLDLSEVSDEEWAEIADDRRRFWAEYGAEIIAAQDEVLEMIFSQDEGD